MEEYVEKNYSLRINFSAKIKKKIAGDFDEQTLNFMQQLIEAFLKNDNALREYFKQYFLDLLMNGDNFDTMSDLLDAKSTEDTAISISENLDSEAKAYIIKVYSKESGNIVKLFPGTTGNELSEDERVVLRDFISDQFQVSRIIDAQFIEI